VEINVKLSHPELNISREKRKIDFVAITKKHRISIRDKMNAICSVPSNYKSFITTEDKNLCNAYILYSFSKLSYLEYAKAWAEFINTFGLNSTYKGIDYLHGCVDKEMKSKMFECFFGNRPLSIYDWIAMQFYQILYKSFNGILEEKCGAMDCNESDKTPLCQDGEILYIYNKNTSCHVNKHQLVSATAILIGKSDSHIELNVEYCPTCHKFYMSYTIYEHYLKKYGFLLGNLRMYSDSKNTPGVVLAEYSPLKLCGYNVSQSEDYTDAEREYIISRIIDRGIMLKIEVVRYLEHFINMNGHKSGNELALTKWKHDLDYTLKYKESEQRKYTIKKVEKY